MLQLILNNNHRKDQIIHPLLKKSDESPPRCDGQINN